MRARPLFSRFHKEQVGVFLGYLSIFILISLFIVSSRGKESANQLFDLIRTTEPRSEVVIVGIDDASLQEFGAWPWNRSVFADLTKALDEAGARVIVYDVLFFEPREGDENFKKVLENTTTPVVLGSKVEQGTYLSSYLGSATGTVRSSLANVQPDRDGKVRTYPERRSIEGLCLLSLSESAFFLYTKKEISSCDQTTGQFRYPKTVTTFSLLDVVRGAIPKESLSGKIVFIGSTSLGLEDHFVGMQGGKVPGVYVHASALTSYLNEVRDVHVPQTVSLGILALLMYLAAALFYQVKRTFLQITAIFVVVFLIIITSALLFSFGYIMPLPALVAGILLSSGYTALARYVQERKQNLFIENLFSKYVHKDVLAELLRSRKELSLGGERKQLTILFSDIRGFTSLSELLSPEKLTSVLNDYLSAMTPCILEEKGTIDKFIGDAIMAFWNAPLDVEHHQLHAVKAALRMQRTLAFFNGIKDTSLAMGVGIHTGQAVVGNVGGKDRVNYTVLGDTVNLSSRLEGLTKKYGVGTIVTKAVRDTIDDPTIVFRCLDVVTVLGKSTPTTLYEARYAEDLDDMLIKKYEKALKYYYDGDWEKAESAFKKLAKEGDVPSEKMLERIPLLRKKKDWDGVWRFDEK